MIGVMDIAAGANHSVALKENGEVWTFGVNRYGQFGHSTNAGTGVNTPNKVAKMVYQNVEQIEAGYAHTLLLTKEDVIWSFGHNRYGQLGNPTNSYTTTTATPTPVQVLFPEK